jgi:peptide-methionine (S)-S-oxide reductase
MRPARPLLALLLSLLLVFGAAVPAARAATEEAVLAGGCFWCLEHDLEGLSGVLEVTSGYSGGKLANPTYRQVSGGGTGHREVVRVKFDTTRLRYEKLLRAYWRNVDPFDGGGQFCDRGESYRPAIFTTNATQAVEARNSVLAAARELGRPASAIKLEIKALNKFWPAEDYHQNYARRNGVQYRYYRWSCGRDRRLDAVWGRRARSAEAWGGSTAQAPARQLVETETAQAPKPAETANPVKSP